jgi:riboflavin kinase/FMN adenylyltransferase
VLEVFLIGFDGDLYGREIDVAFVDYIRGDQRFDGMEALMAQMAKDVARSRHILAESADLYR